MGVTGEEEVRAPLALVYATSDTNSLIYLYKGNNKYCWIKMAMGLLSKVVSDKMSGLLKSDEPEKVPPSEKELKEEEKRKVAQKEAEDERSISKRNISERRCVRISVTNMGLRRSNQQRRVTSR